MKGFAQCWVNVQALPIFFPVRTARVKTKEPLTNVVRWESKRNSGLPSPFGREIGTISSATFDRSRRRDANRE